MPLPSMRLLAKELRISVITTKRSYNDLEQEGFIETITGKGSFVANRDVSIIREGSLRMAEEYLTKAVEIARENAISLEELRGPEGSVRIRRQACLFLVNCPAGGQKGIRYGNG